MILTDENTHGEIVADLRTLNIDVYPIKEKHSGIQDEEVIELAKKSNRIIITEDKDFGKWVFTHKTTGISVIFLRYHFSETAEMVKVVSEIFNSGTERFRNKFTPLTTQKIRSREI